MWAVKRKCPSLWLSIRHFFVLMKCLFVVISENSFVPTWLHQGFVFLFKKHYTFLKYIYIFCISLNCLEQAYSSWHLKKGTHFICPFKTGPVRQTSLLFHALLMSPWQRTSPCRRLPNWQCKTERTHPAIHPAPSLSWAEALPMLLISWYMEIQPVTYQMNRHLLAIKSGIALFIFQRLICWNSREANCKRC